MISIAILLLSLILVLFGMSGPRHTVGGDERRSKAEKHLKDLCRDKKIRDLVLAAKARRDAPPVVTLDQVAHKIRYRSRIDKYGIHIGQRKLGLAEIQVLTMVHERAAKFVVYAGAAPGNKTYLIAKLFPHLKFILVDPNPFDLRNGGISMHKEPIDEIVYVDVEGRETKRHGHGVYPHRVSCALADLRETLEKSPARILIINDFMTNEYARVMNMPGLAYISDIRTNSSGDGKFPTDLDLVWNMAMQFNWILLMKPTLFSLKFRQPYYEDEITHEDYMIEDFELSKKNGIDFVKNYGEKRFQYIDGKIYLQAFAGESSTEARLIGDGGGKIVDYGSYHDYEDAFFYFNLVERTLVHHHNPYADKSIGFDHCNDCALEAHIWEEYCRVTDRPADDIPKLIRQMTEETSRRSFFMHEHGHLF